MTAIPARRRRRAIAAMVTSVLAVIALPSGLVLGANNLLNEGGGNNIDDVLSVDIPETPTALIAVVNARNAVSAIALLAISPSGKGGTILSIPVGAAADVAIGEPVSRIGDSYASGVIDSLRTDVEGLLNVSVNMADDVTADELAVLLAPVGTQSVALRQPVVDTSADAKDSIVLKSGTANLTAADIAKGLASSQVGAPESMRLANVKALWNAVARVGVETTTSDAPSTTVPTTTEDGEVLIEAPTTTEGFFAALFGGKIDVWQFSGTFVNDALRNPQALDLYTLDGGEVLMVMASVAPASLLLVSDSIAVMVDTPFNNTRYAKEAVTRLAYLGANVALVRQTTDPPAEKTVVYYNEVLARTEGESFTGLIGPLEFRDTPTMVTGINLRIVLGNDFIAFLGGGGTLMTTTTTTEP
jgi:hypothetical protein